MLRRVTALAIAAAFIWPAVATAQMSDEEAPSMLVISSWVCSGPSLSKIADDWDNRSVKASQKAVDSGDWASAGIYYHTWADEWNVNYWAVGKDIPSLLKGQEVTNDAYDSMYPDGLNLWDVCSEHKDGFYWLGKSTTPTPESPGPAMALTSWKCTDVDAVNDDWNNYVLAKAQAVVDAGLWTEAGVFNHAWAGPWNVNFYYMGKDIPTILAGFDKFRASIGDDAPNMLQKCTVHKDGFYEFGPTAHPAGG